MSEEATKKPSKFRFSIWAKALLVLTFIVSFLSGAGIGFFSSRIRSVTRNFYIEQSIKTADSLALYLDIEKIKEVKHDVELIYDSIDDNDKVENSEWGTPEWEAYVNLYSSIAYYDEDENLVCTDSYRALYNQIKLFHEKNDAEYLSVVYADFTNKRVVYLVDDSAYGEWCGPGSYDDFTANDMSIFEDKTQGFKPEITNMPEYGYLCSVGRPVYDGEESEENIVAFVMVDLSMEQIMAKEQENTRTLIIILVSISISTLLIGFLLILFLIVRPIRKLTKAANSYIAEKGENIGKFAQVQIRTKDEIEDLSNSMKKMEEDINKYITDLLSTTNKLEGAERKARSMEKLAAVDALTGINNKRAYFEIEDRLNDEIKDGVANFAIAMIDINDLKTTNDTLGHEKGDAAIKTVSSTIKKIFAQSPAYRVGGDEFVVVLEGEDLKNIDKLVKAFKDKEREIKAAIGVAIFDKKKDNNVEDTFKRADKNMYKDKKEMKDTSD